MFLTHPEQSFPLAAAKLDTQRDGNEGRPSAQICRPCKEKEKLEKALSTCTVVDFNISTLKHVIEKWKHLPVVNWCLFATAVLSSVLSFLSRWCLLLLDIVCSRQDEKILHSDWLISWERFRVSSGT